MGKKREKNTGVIGYFIAVIICAALWTLLSFTDLLHKYELRVYDALLSTKPVAREDENVALVEIDDPSLDKLGPWPWSRDIIGDVLLRMKELGVDTAVFDIEYLSESKISVNADDVSVLRQNIGVNDREASALADIMFRDNDGFFAKAVQFFGNTWLTINNEKITTVSSEDESYARERFLIDGSMVDDCEELVKKGNLINSKKAGTVLGLGPANRRFISMARGAGFTNIIIDADGTRRRIELLNENNGKYLGQLVFAPLAARLDVKSFSRTKHALILHDAILDKNGKRGDIRIPLDENGCMLVHWAPGNYADSYKHDSVMIINQLKESEDALIHNLGEFARISLTDEDGVPLSYSDEISAILEDAEYLKNFRTYILDRCNGYDIGGRLILTDNMEPQNISDLQTSYFESREAFFNRVRQFYRGRYKDEISAATDSLLESGAIERDDHDMLRDYFASAFDGVQSQCELYLSTFDSLKKDLRGAFCIVGNSASGSTDLGSTPFSKSFPNVGTHANVYNTIVTQDFITPLSGMWGILFATIVFIVFVPLTQKKKPLFQNVSGGILILLSVGICILLMAGFGIYVPLVTPLLIELSSFFALMIRRFASNEKERQLIKAKFGAYVAPEVVEQIIKNPKYAQVGGDSKDLTALFSDVRKFSKFTEIINNINGEERGAEQLVASLNNYLGALSDAIQSERGTIDKYVGDEIVSFFGAPIDDPENASHACAAAIKMREAEEKINSQYYKEFKYTECIQKPWKEVAAEKKWTAAQIKEYMAYVDEYNKGGFFPMLLQSRVGLNSGCMVVGNMGTEKKLNYTIMGNNVNLASRLEGTNKAYGSWIMVAESTWNRVKESGRDQDFVVRSFDAVRVVNVERPVRIYNVLGFREGMDENRLRAAAIFNKGMELYMHGSSLPGFAKPADELKEALKYFVKANEIYGGDLSSLVFAERCKNFIIKGIPAVWDGVYTMEGK